MQGHAVLRSVVGISAAMVLSAGCSGLGNSVDPISSKPADPGPQSIVLRRVPTVVAGSLLGAMPPVVATTGKSWASPNTTGPLLYACSYYTSDCVWYHVGHDVLAGMITGLNHPEGVAVDEAGYVYVANTGASNILVYAKGSTTILRTLDDSGWYPADIAIDSNGTVYVANIVDTDFDHGSVTVFRAGATTATRIIRDTNFYEVHSLALDEKHNLVVCYRSKAGIGSCDQFVNAYAPGVTRVTGLGLVNGAKFDAAGNFLVNDGSAAATQEFTSAFASCATLPQTGFPNFLALNQNSSDLFVGNEGNGGGADITESTYSGCSTTATIEFTYNTHWGTNSPWGIAIDPRAIP